MFIKARRRATIGYLNLCIALQRLWMNRLHKALERKRLEISQIDMTVGRYINCGHETYVLQINGYVIGSGIPITSLIGETVGNVVIIPGKIINIITQ